MAHIPYLWDETEDNVVEEIGENGETVLAYTTEPTRYGSVLTQKRSDDVRHFHYYGNGNTVELSAHIGVVAAKRRYTAFGEVMDTLVFIQIVLTATQTGGVADRRPDERSAG